MIYVLKTLHFGTKYVTIRALSIQVFFAWVGIKRGYGRTDRTDGPDGRTGRTDRTDGPDGRTGRTDRTDGRDGRTGRTDRTDGRTGRTDGRTDGPGGRTGRTDRTDGPDGWTDGPDGRTDGRMAYILSKCLLTVIYPRFIQKDIQKDKTRIWCNFHA